MLYFAYGSNMWLSQMARRCPGITYVGRGVLYDFCWQINERGYANVVHVPSYDTSTTKKSNENGDGIRGSDTNITPRPCVHGLVYDLGNGNNNENLLDCYEGVHIGAYSKAYLDVELFPALPQQQAVAETVSLIRKQEHVEVDGVGNGELKPDVLVYLSEKYVQPALAKESYVGRMAEAVKDALVLGVPCTFVEEHIAPTMPRGFLSDVGLHGIAKLQVEDEMNSEEC